MASDLGGLSGVILDAAEKLGMKLQQTLWVGKEQAKAAESLRARVLGARERLASQAPRIGGVAREVSDLSREGAALGERARVLAAEEGRARSEIRAAMEEIRILEEGLEELQRVAASNEALTQGLLKAVEGVSGFLSQIGKVTRQTQMLALNAAIEAARAGEAGRGFAVVAEEVRKLAEESNQAARQVGEIIGVLQNHAEGSIRVTEQTSTIMAATVVKAQEARSGLEVALEEIGKINDVMQNIASVAQEQAAASAEMAHGIDQVTKGTVDVVDSIESIRKSAVETTKASEGVAQEAQAMAEGAQRMHELLGRFKVEGGSGLALPGGR